MKTEVTFLSFCSNVNELRIGPFKSVAMLEFLEVCIFFSLTMHAEGYLLLIDVYMGYSCMQNYSG